jgi:type I restriction enzyme M protein
MRTPKLHNLRDSLSTGQQLASLIKSCRDIMRKHKGLTTDLDRLPMLTWFEEVLRKVDRLRAFQAETAAELGAILPSILDRAFKGEP